MLKRIMLIVLFFVLCLSGCVAHKGTHIMIDMSKNNKGYKYTFINSLHPTVEWSTVPGAVYYTVEWFEIVPSTTEAIKKEYFKKITSTSYTFQEKVIIGRVYEFHITAIDQNGEHLVATSIRFVTSKNAKGVFLKATKSLRYKRNFIKKSMGIDVRVLGEPFSSMVRIKNGILVDAVVKGSNAFKAGFEHSDIIVDANGKKVDINGLYNILVTKRGHASYVIEFMIIRGWLEGRSEALKLKYETKPVTNKVKPNVILN